MSDQTFYRESWKTFSNAAIKNTLMIRELNDRMRKTLPRTQDAVILMGDLRSDLELGQKVLSAARAFDAFTEDNDPYGEHDCATFEVEGERFMFKIDYYDMDLRFGSEQPWNAAVTRRVMSLFYARDY